MASARTKVRHGFLAIWLFGIVGTLFAGAPNVRAGTHSDEVRDTFLRAYPGTTEPSGASSLLVRGTKVAIGLGTTGSFDDRMTHSDLVDQLSQRYLLGCPVEPPAVGHDPGRLRSDAFFRAMYGATAQKVSAQLVSVAWFGTSLQVTKVNGVDDHLRAVASALAVKPELRKFLVNPGGTFVWRPIAGTTVQSAHSFGIAIDVNTKYSDYWRWQNTSRVGAYKNRIPCEIAEIFEREGFIWGAKWWHFDTMHFEYRPELL